MDTRQILTAALVFFMIAICAMALFYLKDRNLNRVDRLGWTVLAILVPVIGPFLVIVSRPGLNTPENLEKN